MSTQINFSSRIGIIETNSASMKFIIFAACSLLCTAYGFTSSKISFGRTLTSSHHFATSATVLKSEFTPKVASDSKFPALTYKPVISFGPNHKGEVKIFSNEKEMRNILGGKGANLGGMSALGLSVPPGFTLTTEVCSGYQHANGKLSESVWRSVLSALKKLENDVGRKFGDDEAPLLVSVRSGAAISMPGMLDTVLNLGVNDVSVKGLGRQFGERFALVSFFV